MAEQASESWDAEAATFDDAPDHGLRDPDLRAAWMDLLKRYLPMDSSRIADLGCGTGSLSVVMAELGHHVDGVDFSPEMIRAAVAKTNDLGNLALHLGDVSHPSLPSRRYDVVTCRHVLWALPDPLAALRAWTDLLSPGGRMILIEGQWSTGAGLTAVTIEALLAAAGMKDIDTEDLADPRYWGGPVDDQRYVSIGRWC